MTILHLIKLDICAGSLNIPTSLSRCGGSPEPAVEKNYYSCQLTALSVCVPTVEDICPKQKSLAVAW